MASNSGLPAGMGSELFSASVSVVLHEAKSVKELRKWAHANLLQFAVDTCLVAYGIRTGYLVDAIWSPDPTRTFSALLRALHKKSSIFKNIVLWNHSSSAQSFLVNIPLFEEKVTGLIDGIELEQCAFVRLDECLSASTEPPNALQQVLLKMRASMAASSDALSFSLPATLTQEILVPLAAVVIDYSVAYVPASSEQTSFLGGEALDIYSVSFKGPSYPNSSSTLKQEHVVLKFSCPRVLVSKHAELSPGTVMEKLRVKFESRLESVGIHMSVAHRTETLDRVAL